MSQEAENKGAEGFDLGIIPGASQKISTAATSAASTALDSGTTLVQLFATQDCYVRVGAGTPTAVTTDHFIPKGIIQWIGVLPIANTPQKIAAIRDSADGTLYITEAK